MDHHENGSSLNCIIIIIDPAISSKWCYLSILLVIVSSTDPTLFHVGCRPILHVGLHIIQHLYLTQSERPSQHLHLTMGGIHLTTMLERLYTYI